MKTDVVKAEHEVLTDVIIMLELIINCLASFLYTDQKVVLLFCGYELLNNRSKGFNAPSGTLQYIHPILHICPYPLSQSLFLLQTTERIIFRPRMTKTVRCECLFLPLCVFTSVLSPSCLPPDHFPHLSYLTPRQTPILSYSVFTFFHQPVDQRSFCAALLFKLDLSAPEQQGGGAESGL